MPIKISCGGSKSGKGSSFPFPANGKVFTGAELMEKGLENPLNTQFESAVLILIANN